MERMLYFPLGGCHQFFEITPSDSQHDPYKQRSDVQNVVSVSSHVIRRLDAAHPPLEFENIWSSSMQHAIEIEMTGIPNCH
jgi:hypothetical protein